MKKTLLCLFSLLTSLASVLPAHATRLHTLSLNDAWRFRMEEQEEWQAVHLPHTWNTDAYVVKDYLRGVGTYQRELTIPEEMQGKRLFLRVDAASKTLSVSVNGHSYDLHVGGYNAASYDITEAIDPAGTNHLELVVDNATDLVPPTSADFTFQGGVYRDVWLIATEAQHFSLTDHGAESVYISTPHVNESEAEVSVRATVCNEADQRMTLTLRTEIFSPQGASVTSATRKIKIAPRAELQVEDMTLRIPAPQLWSPESPALYRVETSIIDGRGRIIDQSWHYTGMRWFGFDAEHGFSLNGKPYKLHGVCRHQDQKPYGVALTDEQHRRDFRLMKEMGANFIRISHYPQDDALLELCDREGMLAWEEIPIVNLVPEGEEFARNCESMLLDMMRQHYNHPSIILWGYMNEILLRMPHDKDGKMPQDVVERTLALARHLEDVVRREDPYRLSTMAFHGSDDYNTSGLSELSHVVGWNLYEGWYGGDLTGFERFLERQHREHPTHPMIVSEYGAGSDRRLHSFDPKPFDFSIEYHQLYAEHYLDVIERTPYVMGGSYWNMIDFSSALREESMPRINNKGLLYSDRTPKDVYYLFQAYWLADRPMVHIATRDWPQRTLMADVPVQQVRIYSNQPEVELLLDGISLGTRQTMGHVAIFDVPMHAGQNVLVAQAGEAMDAHIVEVSVAPVVLSQFDAPTFSDASRVDAVTANLGQGESLCLGVNLGSNCFFTSDASQFTWVPERPYTPGSWGYVGGKAVASISEVSGTTDGPLYQTTRQGMEAFRADVPNGTYEVELFIAQQTGEGESSVYLLGRNAGAKMQAVRIRQIYEVTDSQGLTITLDEQHSTRSLAAIPIRQL